MTDGVTRLVRKIPRYWPQRLKVAIRCGFQPAAAEGVVGRNDTAVGIICQGRCKPSPHRRILRRLTR